MLPEISFLQTGRRVKRYIVVLLMISWSTFAQESESSSPEQAAIAHMKALDTLDKAQIVATKLFPFAQLMPDGKKKFMKSLKEHEEDTAPSPYKFTLTNTELLDETNGTALVRVTFGVTAPDGTNWIGNAWWAFTSVEGKWLLSWRQYLGRTLHQKNLAIFPTPN